MSSLPVPPKGEIQTEATVTRVRFGFEVKVTIRALGPYRDFDALALAWMNLSTLLRDDHGFDLLEAVQHLPPTRS